jgi:hypothetical protein
MDVQYESSFAARQKLKLLAKVAQERCLVLEKGPRFSNPTLEPFKYFKDEME